MAKANRKSITPTAAADAVADALGANAPITGATPTAAGAGTTARAAPKKGTHGGRATDVKAGKNQYVEFNHDYEPNHKGARGEFLEMMRDHDGRPVSEFATAYANGPARIAKGTVAYGSFLQWLNWFVKQGAVRVVTKTVAPESTDSDES